MNAEHLTLLGTEREESELNDAGEFTESEGFDLDAFFGVKDEKKAESEESISPDSLPENQQQMPNLLLNLKNDANESIATLTTKITADSFAAGASLTSSVFSTLSSLVGSCGVFCAHSLGALGQTGSSLLGASGLAGGMSMPGFSVDQHGHFHLEGNIDSLSKATGLSKSDLLAGKFSAQDILMAFFSAFGEGIYCVFGFGLIDTLLDGLLPGTSSRAA